MKPGTNTYPPPILSPTIPSPPHLIYKQLLEFISEVFPEKIANLPEDNSRMLLSTINMGLSSFGSQVTAGDECF